MPAYIRYIGVDGTIERKLRQAAPIATMYSRKADVDKWDGGQCDVVVAGTGAAGARDAVNWATAEGIPVIAIDDADELGETTYKMPRQSSIADMGRVLTIALESSA